MTDTDTQATELHEYLVSQSVADLKRIAAALAGGKLGFDTARDWRTNTKAKLVGFIESDLVPFQRQYTDGFITDDDTDTQVAVYAEGGILSSRTVRIFADVHGKGTQTEPPATDNTANNTDNSTVNTDNTNPDQAKQLVTMLQNIAGGSVDEATVRTIVAEEVAKAEPTKVEHHIQPLNAKSEAGDPPVLATLLQLYAAGERNFLLVGPSGTGKTYTANLLAERLDVAFGSISYTAGASESWLLGRYLPTGANGAFELQRAAFTGCYSQPSVFLHDEIDAADPNLMVVINSALANGGFTNPMTGDYNYRHPDTVQIAAANTYGTGADALYTAREALDGATLDRFYTLPVDYDVAFEKTQGPSWIVDKVHTIRKRAQEAGIKRTVSVRMIQRLAKAAASGIDHDTAMDHALAGWTDDERAQVGV